MAKEAIYFSIGDIPLDTWNGFDEDNSYFKLRSAFSTPFDLDQEIRAINSTPIVSVESPLAARYVPFIRTIKLNTIGQDVLAVKRALSKAGFGKWGEWGTRDYWFGPNRVKLLKKFQHAHGLKADGVYGPATHAKLAPFFDDHGIWLLHQVHLISPADKKRDAIVATAMLAYSKRYLIHYTQSGLRMWGIRNRVHPPSVPPWEDCSSISTWYYWLANAPDPNGLGYPGYGYTGTQINHGRRVSLAQAKPGDLVFYGWSHGIPTHVAVYVGGGRVVSHGSEIGPLLLSATYRSITSIHTYI
jgi:hypothetical protein